MHRQINAAIKQGFLDFLGEQPLTARFRQRAVLNHVARCLDDHDLKIILGQTVGIHQTPSCFMSLSQCQQAAARADFDSAGCH